MTVFMPQCLAVFLSPHPHLSVDSVVDTQCLRSVLMPSVAGSVLILGVDPPCSHFSVHQLVGLDLFNGETRPSGHISRPTQVNVFQSSFSK